MEIIYLLIPLSLILVAFAIWAFFWAVKSGQFNDLDSPGLSILDDDEQESLNTKKEARASSEVNHPDLNSKQANTNSDL